MTLITGANGYVGSMLMTKIEAIGVDNLSRNIPIKKIHHFCDVRDIDEIARIIETHQIDTVINLAAIVGDPECDRLPKYAEEINHQAVKELVKLKQIKRFIQASTCSVYGINPEECDEETKPNPQSLYAETKLKAEEAIQASGKEYVILRFSTVCGVSTSMRYDLTVNELCRDALKKSVDIYRPRDYRPYCDVEDIAESCFNAIRLPAGIYNVGGYNMNKYDIVNEIERALGERVAYIVRDNNMDRRNYKVKFNKYLSHAKKLKWMSQSMQEIIEHARQNDAYADQYRATYCYE